MEKRLSNRERRMGKRLVSLLLTLVLCVQFLPQPALAYIAEQAGSLTFIGKDGAQITTDKSWEETFPYGTFAFQNSQMKIEEGGETGVLQVYRLGGTTGRAVAYIQYTPAYAQISEDAYTYANAAGYGDVEIQVEDPLPIAQYQPIGKAPGPFAPEVPVTITVEAPETPEIQETPEEDVSLPQEAPETAEGGDYTLTLNVRADAYQWYVLGDGWEEAVSGAEDAAFVVGAEDYAEYDFYCVYTINGVRYGSMSAKGAAFAEAEEETLEKAPEGLPLNPDPTYTLLKMDPEKPYQSYVFPMTFADGEWVKEIRVSAPQDETPEPDKFGTFTIIKCEGGSLYAAANTLALHVADDEAPEPSQLGFAVTEAEFDKSAGTAELTVRRTGGRQSVVSVEYATEDGTAVAGEDYSPVSGTLSFYTDIDEQTITIPLIDNGVESQERVTFRVVLSNVRGGGTENLCTLIEGMDTALVSLYNSNTAQEENLATMLYDSEAVDLTEQVTEESGSVAPVGAEAVTGEQEAEPEEALEAVIGYGPEDIVPYTFNYSQPIRFSRSSIGSYNGNYWKDYTQVTDNGYNGWEADRFGLGSWFGDGVSNVDGGKRLSSDTNRRATLSIPNISHYYQHINAGYRFEAAIGTYGQLVTGREYVYPWTEFKISGSKICGTDAGVTHVSGWPTYKISWHTSGSMSGGWSMDRGSSGELILGLSKYDSHGSDDDAYCHLRYAMLQRRTFSNNLNLTVYTANDADTVPEGAAQLTSYSGVYDSMRPKVTIVPREGGVNSSGRLYVGSKLKIELANTASYFPARPESAGANYDYTVYLTNSSGNIVARATKGSGNDYYLTMDWGGLRNGGLSDQYTLNIVMTRKQNITLDITPSIDRQVDENGNTLPAIDTSKCIEAWERFLGSATREMTIGRSPSTAGRPHFGKNVTVENLPHVDVTDKSQTYTWNSLENVQWINFNLSPEDRIVFNGRTYAGNEQIWLTMADLASSNLTFYYYHKDFLTSESVMTPTLDHMGLYLDGNGNGRIDGWFNRETGYFVVDEASGDTFIAFLEDGADYDESIFEPVKINGKYCQYFLKAFYTKLPRCLVPQTGQEDQRAQILPAFVSNITDSGNYAELTREQQSYRYIIAGQNRAYANNWEAQRESDYACSADNLLMYGGEATRMEVLDIPLGGDTNPPQMTQDKKGYTWTPDYKGNLLYAFQDPEPIFIPHSLAGDNIPVASIAGVREDGTITYEDNGAAKINGYLGSYTANSTVALCVQEQTQTTAGIAAANGGSAWPGVLESGGRTFSARSDGGSGGPNLEAVTISENGTFPNSAYMKQQSGQEAGKAGIDMKDSGNEFDEFDLDLGIELPSTDIGITDFATIIMDGYEVGFAIGMDLGGYEYSTANADSENGGKTPADALKDSGEAMGQMLAFLSDPAGASEEADGSYKEASGGEYSTMGFGVSVGVSMAFLFKYNPVDNTYYFSQFSIAASAGVSVSYQYRLSICPIIYVYATAEAGLELATGASVERQTVTEAMELPTGAGSLKKGQTIRFPVTYKSFDIEFSGKFLVELFSDEACNKPVKKVGDHKFNSGFIKSDGGDAVTVTLVQKDGYDLDGQTTYYVLLTALEDSAVTALEKVTKMETISYWSGFSLSPELFVEVAAGVGVEIMKFEIYFNIGVGCAFTLGAFDTDEMEYKGFSFDEFEFALALGFRVVLLAFSYEMDMIGYKITYDGESGKWWKGGSALGGLYSNEDGDGEGWSRSARMSNGSGESSSVHVKLPGSTAYTQEIYTGEDSGITPFAFDPTDKENVPFQLSGYGSSGDAFKLADGLSVGYDYQVVSVDGQNYVVYTISREDSGNLHPVDYTMLVLSRLRLTNEDGRDTYGLVNPIDPENSTPYILLDTTDGSTDDGAGDLDFHVWVDGKTICAAWVSYKDPANLTSGAGTEPTETKPTYNGTAMNENNYTEEGFKPVEPAEVQAPTDPKPTEPQQKDYYLTVEEYAALTDTTEQGKYVAVPETPDPGAGGDASGASDGGTGGTGSDPTTPAVAFYSVKDERGNAKYQTLKDAKDAFAAAHMQYEMDHADWVDKNSAYQDYLTAKAAYDADKAAYDAWFSYFQNLNDYNSQVQDIAAAAAKNTVVKTASFNTANPDTGFTEAAPVSGSEGSHVFLPNIADGNVVVYGKAEHFNGTELNAKISEYEAYLELAYSDAGRMEMKEVMESTRTYRLTYQKGLWDVNGKSSKLCVSVDGNPAIEIALAGGQTLENIEAAKIGNTYYAAYTTGEQKYEGSDLVNIRRLYLRTFTVSNTDSTVTMGAPLLLRTVCDYDRDSTKDGLYAGTALKTLYADPYFSNLQFLYGRLGGIQGTDESFTVRAMSADTAEHFLLFEMNGSTYVIPQSSLKNITTSHRGQIIPFFTPPEEHSGGKVSASTGRGEVTIGADGAGNIAAVYTGSVANTGNNAIYLTKWDPNSRTWGAGVMLAMNHMQVCEDAAENGWSGEETEAAYLGKRDGYNGGGMDQFTFSNLQIALGQTKTNSVSAITETGPEETVRTAGAAGAGADGAGEPEETGIPEPRDITDSANSSRDTLLVLTQGSLRYLKTREADVGGDGEKETILVPMSDSEALAAWNSGPRKPGVGVYAISYGVGGQSIGRSSLSFQSYNFSAGSELTAYLSFTNTGDVAIRASVANPAKVELKLYAPQTAGQTGGNTSTLASWKLTENVRSGQEVRLSGRCAELTQDLPEGSIFYIEAREDAEYIDSIGGTAFQANTLTCDKNGVPVGGDLVVEKKAELALEDVNITSVNADDKGNTTLQVEFLASNRGSETAEDVFARFRYEDAEGNYQPLDISNSDLNVSAAQALPFSLRASDPLQQGILYLKSKESGDNGSLPAGMYRKVSGTITVPPEVYQGSLTGSLNLHVELFSDADGFNAYGRENADTYSAKHDEYNSVNNASLTQIEHKTFFTAADQVILALGTTVRLPVAYTTTTGSAPNILAEEVPDTGASDGAQLGILYYESTGAGSGMVVLTPSALGTGVIHLKDEATNTIRSIPFKVVGAGEGIDIYKDNGIFTFYNKDKSEYDDTAASGTQNWDFTENTVVWGTGGAQEAPMRNNLSRGQVGSSFTFSTMAASIDLYFAGTVRVSSTFPGFTAKTCTGTAGNRPVTIRFGSNPDNLAHTVTVEVTGTPADGGGYALFDRMTETYTQKPPTPSDDGTAPHIYWSRSFPETASIKTGTETVELTCYVLDDGALANLTLNGAEPENLVKNSGGFWQFTTTVKENGMLAVAATDTSGNRTSRSARVDWFNAVPDSGAISGAPKLEAQFQNEDGSALTDYLTAGKHACLAAKVPETLAEGDILTASRIVAQETSEGTSELAEVTLDRREDGRFDATANGWYILRLRSKDAWRQAVLEMDKVDAEVPIVSLTENEPTEENEYEWGLDWRAYKSNPRLTPIAEVKINGESVETGERQTQLAGIWPIFYSGSYTLTAKDSAGNESTATRMVENHLPLDLTGAANLTRVKNAWNQDEDNGVVTVDLTGVTGGMYVAETFTQLHTYVGSYEFCVVPAIEEDGEEEPAEPAWTAWEGTAVDVGGLETGDYLLRIRDSQDPDNEDVTVEYPFSVGSDAVTCEAQANASSSLEAPNGSIELKAAGGKDTRGYYQFQILPLEGEDAPLTDVRELEEEAWEAPSLDSEDPAAIVREELLSGWYQIAVRTMADVEETDIEDLRTLSDAVAAARERVDAAQQALRDRTEAENRIQGQINTAFSQWNAAVTAAADQAAEDAWKAYKALIEEDTAILEALEAWREADGQIPDGEDLSDEDAQALRALEETYHAAVKSYTQKRALAEAEVEKTAAEAALEQAKTDYETKEEEVSGKVRVAYGADSPLWANAYTRKIYLSTNHTHAWAEEWSSDGEYHWHDCTAENCDTPENSGKEGYGPHEPGAAAACGTDQICTVCGHVLEAALGHDYGALIPETDSTTIRTGMKAHYVCSRCGMYFDENKEPTTEEALTIPVKEDSGGDSGDTGGGSKRGPNSAGNTHPVELGSGTSSHGKVTVSPSNAAPGRTVTLTVQPDRGYTLDTLSVTDSRGKEVRLTERGGGKYFFTMPGRTVTIEASFVPLSGAPGLACDGGADCPSHGFLDLGGADAWYHEAVDYVLRSGLMNGYSGRLFGPNEHLTRAQLAQILYNREGRPAVTAGSPFTDVANGAWCSDAVTWAAANGIVGGYGNGIFGPNDNITREQLAVMLWRSSGSPAATNKELHFSDADEIGGYGLDAIRWAVENGILNGFGDGRLGPKGLATRAQAAQMLKNFIEKQEENP